MPPTTSRSYASGHFELAIDGHKSTAFLKSVEGGWAHGQVIDDPVGAGTMHVKHLATVDIDPFSFEFGLSEANDVLKWIQASWKRQYGRRNGQVTHANFDLYEAYSHEFYDALLTETAFPALDGSAKESGYIKVKVQPERVVTSKLPGNGNRIQGNISPKVLQKLWTPSAFRFHLENVKGLEYVNKIDSFTIKQAIKKVYTGGDRFPQVEPTSISFPNLTGTISLEYADDLLKWHQQYIVDGKQSDKEGQTTGAIEFLSTDRKTTLFWISLFGVGVSSAMIEPSTANQGQIKRVKFELFVQRMEMEGIGPLAFEPS